MPEFETLFEDCCKLNATVDTFGHSDKTLADHLNDLSGIVERNKERSSLKDGTDVQKLAADYVAKRLSDEAAGDVYDALAKRVLTTADHHGGLFSAQAFQGDMYFGELLKRMGYKGRFTPLFSFSIVELENSTYGRGICAYESPDKRQQIPIQPKRDLNRMVTVTKAYDEEMLERAKIQMLVKGSTFSRAQYKYISKLIDRIYKDKDILSKERYADQIFLIGERLSGEYFTDDDSRHLCYTEAEEITTKLFVKDIKDESSLIWHIFYDEKVREAFDEIKTEDGLKLSNLLLRGVDPKGRRIHTELTPDGKLLGAGFGGQRVQYDIDPDTLIGHVNKRELIPAGFAEAVMLFFERGYTWLGGYFQAIYLTKWRDMLKEAFDKAGKPEEAKIFKDYDCTGYISGPVYILNDAGEGLVSTGPLELSRIKMTASSFEERMSIKMKDAHKMGLFEIYLDLVAGEAKMEGWYRVIAEHLRNNYGEYAI